MIQSNQHIVTKFKWETSFDDKHQANDLQNSLSALTKEKISRSINDVFKRFCPENQIWRINNLKLDLGEIQYADIENDLPLKLKNVLESELTNLIAYSASRGNEIEVISKKESQLQLFQRIFEGGYISSNYDSNIISFNSLLSYYIENNKDNLRHLLSISVENKKARKRLVLQSSYKNLKKVIEFLEPVYSNFIIKFINELYELQKKYNFFGDALSKFKDNLLLFAFNYIFEQKVILFNQNDFVDSCLRQIIGYYTVDASGLLISIQKSNWDGYILDTDINLVSFLRVDRFQLKMDDSIPSKGISTNTNSNSLNKTSFPSTLEFSNNNYKPNAYYWKTFEALLKAFNLHKFHINKEEFNTLVINLSQEDESKFLGLLKSTETNLKSLKRVFAILNEAALKSILKTFSAEGKSQYLKQIEALALKCQSVGLITHRQEVFKIGIEFLLNTKLITDYKLSKLINYTISSLSKTYKINKSFALQKLLIERPIDAMIDVSINVVEIEDSIKMLFKNEASSSYIRREILETLNQFMQYFEGDFSQDIQFTHLEASLKKWIILYPIQTLKLFKDFKDRKTLNQAIYYVMDMYSIKVFLSKANIQLYEIVLNIIEHIENNTDKLKSNKLSKIETVIYKDALKMVLENKNPINVFDFLEQLLEQSSFYVKQILQDIIESLVIDKNSNFNNISTNEKVELKLKENLYTYNSKNNINYIIKQIQKEDIDKYKAAQRIEQLIAKENARNFIINNTNAFAIIIDYIVPNGLSLIKKYKVNYLEFFKKNEDKQVFNTVSLNFDVLLWNCALDFTLNEIRYKNFESFLETTIYYYFNWSPSRKIDEKIKTKKPNQILEKIKLGNKKKLSLDGVFILIENYFKTNNNNLEIVSNSDIKKALHVALDNSPRGLIEILSKTILTPNQIDKLKKTIDFDWFCIHTERYITYNNRHLFTGILSMYRLITYSSKPEIAKVLLRDYWSNILYIINHKKENTLSLKQLVLNTINALVDELNYDTVYIRKEIKDKGLKIPHSIQRYLIDVSDSFLLVKNYQEPQYLSKALDDCVQNNMLFDVCYELCLYNKMPTWFAINNNETPSELLSEIMLYYPTDLFRVLKLNSLSEANYLSLYNIISFSEFTNAIGNLYTKTIANLNKVTEFYNALQHITIEGISKTHPQFLLFKIVLQALKQNDWKSLEAVRVITTIAKQLSTKSNCSRASILRAFTMSKLHLPLSFQAVINLVEESNNTLKPHNKTSKTRDKALQSIIENKDFKTSGIQIRNAGIILINNYITRLFDVLQLTEDGKFKDEESQLDAVHILQYVATGLTQTEELLLPLNKLLCGLKLSDPIYRSIIISKEFKSQIEEMITAIISHWSSIEGSSIDGFRGNWLIRDGLLFEHIDRWELKIEKKAYDLLINQSPFSFSIIKYPWMEKPLHVKWNY